MIRKAGSVSALRNCACLNIRLENIYSTFRFKGLGKAVPSSAFGGSGKGPFARARTCQRFLFHDQGHDLGCQIHGIGIRRNIRYYSKKRRRQLKEEDGSVSANVLVRSMVSIIQKAETERWDTLLNELCAAAASEITPSLSVQVIKRIKKPELASRFFEWLEHLEGFEHDGLTYSAIIKVLTRDCNPSHASLADSLLRKKIHHGSDVTPADYDYVLCQWARVRKPEKGVMLLDEMINRGFVPAITSCSILLEELLSSKDEDMGWSLFYQMLAGRVDALDTETFNVVMKALCIRGRLEEALELFTEMKGKDYMPDLDSFNILIKGCCEKGEVKTLCHLFQYMLDIKVKPDSYTVNLMIKELCKQGRPERGNYLFHHMRRVGWIDRKFVYTQLVESLCAYGWWLKALKILTKMLRRGHHPSPHLYINLMRCLCMGGRFTEAFKLKDLISKKGFLPEIKIYAGLINGLCLTGRMDMVNKLLSELRDKGLDLNKSICNMILHGHCILRNMPAALEWVEKIKAKGWNPSAEPCNSLITILSKEGKIDEALLLKNRIQEVVDVKQSTYAVLIDELKN